MDLTSFLLLGAAAIVVFAVGMLAMAVGAIFKRKCLRGSCGGPEVRDANGEVIACADCPNRHEDSGNTVVSEMIGRTRP